ncbi:MAG: hypothetical protein HGA78_08575 [Nitrospirales bacterium]|nr:hypothetical protein [Nitrospirales bacterium]
MPRRSRYDNSAPFQAEPGASKRFPGIRPRSIGPATGVLEHTVKEWDRPDLLALNYYIDGDLWWRILDATPEILCAIDLLESAKTGTVILVPRARE